MLSRNVFSRWTINLESWVGGKQLTGGGGRGCIWTSPTLPCQDPVSQKKGKRKEKNQTFFKDYRVLDLCGSWSPTVFLTLEEDNARGQSLSGRLSPPASAPPWIIWVRRNLFTSWKVQMVPCAVRRAHRRARGAFPQRQTMPARPLRIQGGQAESAKVHSNKMLKEGRKGADLKLVRQRDRDRVNLWQLGVQYDQKCIVQKSQRINKNVIFKRDTILVNLKGRQLESQCLFSVIE